MVALAVFGAAGLRKTESLVIAGSSWAAADWPGAAPMFMVIAPIDASLIIA